MSNSVDLDFVCLFSYFTSQSTIFQLCWVGLPGMCLALGHNAVRVDRDETAKNPKSHQALYCWFQGLKNII